MMGENTAADVVFCVCTIDNEYHSSNLQAHLLLPFHNPNKSTPPSCNNKNKMINSILMSHQNLMKRNR